MNGSDQRHKSACLMQKGMLGFNFGVGAQKEMNMWCVKDMYRLKAVSSDILSV